MLLFITTFAGAIASEHLDSDWPAWPVAPGCSPKRGHLFSYPCLQAVPRHCICSPGVHFNALCRHLCMNSALSGAPWPVLGSAAIWRYRASPFLGRPRYSQSRKTCRACSERSCSPGERPALMHENTGSTSCAIAHFVVPCRQSQLV